MSETKLVAASSAPAETPDFEAAWRAASACATRAIDLMAEERKARKAAEVQVSALRAERDRLRGEIEHALPFVEHFRGGWSTHGRADYNAGELADRLRAALAPQESGK